MKRLLPLVVLAGLTTYWLANVQNKEEPLESKAVSQGGSMSKEFEDLVVPSGPERAWGDPAREPSEPNLEQVIRDPALAFAFFQDGVPRGTLTEDQKLIFFESVAQASILQALEGLQGEFEATFEIAPELDMWIQSGEGELTENQLEQIRTAEQSYSTKLQPLVAEASLALENAYHVYVRERRYKRMHGIQLSALSPEEREQLLPDCLGGYSARGSVGDGAGYSYAWQVCSDDFPELQHALGRIKYLKDNCRVDVYNIIQSE